MFRAVDCVCQAHADLFVQRWFGDCIYTTWEFVAFVIGMSSVMFWIVAQLPQLITNYKNQSADGISPWLLTQWLAGDSFNLLGCILTGDQLPSETFTASYFIVADCVIIIQYMYYTMRAKEIVILAEEEERKSKSMIHNQITDFLEPFKPGIAESQNQSTIISILEPSDSVDQQELHHLQHPATYIAGRSGATIIAHATHDVPVATDHRSQKGHFVAESGSSPRIVTSSLASKQPMLINLLGHPDAAEESLKVEGSADRKAEQFGRREEKALSLEDYRLSTALLPEVGVEQLFSSTDAMRHHLSKLVMRHGLECSPPSEPRLTIDHAHAVEIWLPGQNWPSRKKRSSWSKAAIQGVACLATLVAVITSANHFRKSGCLFDSPGRKLSFEAPGSGTWVGGVASIMRIFQKLPLSCGESLNPWWIKSFGSCIGWGSSFLYIGSRFSQIALNHKRRSAEGLSSAMILFAILANLCTSTSIFMRVQSMTDLISKGPWILGSLGTVSLDIFLFLQAKYFEARPAKLARDEPDEHTPLMSSCE